MSVVGIVLLVLMMLLFGGLWMFVLYYCRMLSENLGLDLVEYFKAGQDHDAQDEMIIRKYREAEQLLKRRLFLALNRGEADAASLPEPILDFLENERVHLDSCGDQISVVGRFGGVFAIRRLPAALRQDILQLLKAEWVFQIALANRKSE